MTLDESLMQAMRAFASGLTDQAEELAQRILEHAPNCDRAYQVLGGVAFRRKDWPGAVQALQQALRLAPGTRDYEANLAVALNNWSNVLRTQGRYDDAENTVRQALSLQPGLAEAWVNLGAVLHEQARYEDALAAFEQALRLNPELALAAFNAAIALEHLDRLSDAENFYRQSLRWRPNWAQALNNLGTVLKSQGRLNESLNCFDQALAIDPNYMVARTNRLAALQCCWQTSLEQLLHEHREWGVRHCGMFDASKQRDSEAMPACTVTRPPVREQERLRIGFVSPDFGHHPVGRFLIQVFENLPKDRLCVFCYSDRKQIDDMTERFRSRADHWCDACFLTDDELTHQIRRDDLDLLIDLAGHTGRHRLLVFAHRAARVQATWMGYPGTTGLPTMDWIIADPTLIPPANDRFYSERVLRLPRSSFSFEPPEFARDLRCSSSPSERCGYITFGSFNKLDKTTPEVLEVWARVLAQVPDSRLVLRQKGLNDSVVRQRFIDFFTARGISAERIECHGWCQYEDLIAAYAEIDIVLDTHPFSGGATSADALWCGVPVVTLIGATSASRQTASLLKSIGFEDTITTSVAEYVACCERLSAPNFDRTKLRHEIHGRIRKSPLRDGAGLAADFAAACFQMASTDSEAAQ